MMKKQPILLSFYAYSNGNKLIVYGHLTYSLKKDLSFKGFSAKKTFLTLLSLYRTKFVVQQEIELIFNTGTIRTTTDAKGSFYCSSDLMPEQTSLLDIRIAGASVKFMDELYDRTIHTIKASTILVSDIDDTVLHSFISNKLVKFITLMFTSMEKRRAVEPTMKLIRDLYASGVTPFYLSNSEQNLYPLIYRFLKHNNFPKGPLFLKEMRRLRDVFKGKKFPVQNLHKLATLNQLIRFFPEKKFILVGDNTQHDLDIYMNMADKFPNSIQYIIILKVINRPKDNALVTKSTKRLKEEGIGLYYGNEFPSKFEL
ncbi:MAG: App1 family protein [Cytophagales bacterium]|nr:App1 family protein [Cytophaga sp.]